MHDVGHGTPQPREHTIKSKKENMKESQTEERDKVEGQKGTKKGKRGKGKTNKKRKAESDDP